MRYFLSYLWRSPLIRLAMIWFVIGMIGISVFSYRLIGMRAELSQTNEKLGAYIEAIQDLETHQGDKKTEMDKILEEIQQYRPTVGELLTFVRTVEDLAAKYKVYLFFHTVSSGVSKAKQNEDFVSYKLGFSSSYDQIENFLKEFENLPYAMSIQSIDVSKKDANQYVLRLIFILYTKLS